MPNPRWGCLSAVTILLGLSGCGLTDEVPTGPKFVVAAKNVVPAIPVALTDDRPKWERKYFPGTSEPEQYETAITFVPMENLQPSAGELLKQKIAAALNPVSDRPARIDVEIRSFRVVYDDRNRYRAWHEERVAARQKRLDEHKKSADNKPQFCPVPPIVAPPPPNYEHHLRRKKGQSKDEWEAEQRQKKKKKKKKKAKVDADPSATSLVVGAVLGGLLKHAFKGLENGAEAEAETTPTVVVIGERAEISWVLNSELTELLEDHPCLDSVIPYHRRGSLSDSLSLLRDLRSRRFDLVFDLQGLLRTGVMTTATGADVRVGLESAREGSGAACHLLLADTGRFVPAHLRYWKVAEALGMGNLSRETHVPIPAADRNWAVAKLAPMRRPILAVNPGARWVTKRWPIEHFAVVAAKASRYYGFSTVILGSRGERPLALQLEHLLRRFTPAAGIVNLAGETTLKQLAATLQSADVMLTNDSGPMHLAAGLGTPVLGIFTCTDPVRSGPPGDVHELTPPADPTPLYLPRKDFEQGWIKLFDDKTLFGWKANSDANWTVADGVISADRGKAGLLLTTVPFADYELSCDYRLAKGGNSGIFLRTKFNPTDPAVDCYELNMCDSHPMYPTGSLVGRAKPSVTIGGEGDWKRFLVTVKGKRITARLDGRVLIDFVDDTRNVRMNGLIGLQYRQGKIEFRNVHLKPLGTTAIFNGTDLTGWKTIPGAKGKTTIEEKTIHMKGGPTFVQSKKSWGDFVLQADVRTNAERVNSGIFFRSMEGTEKQPANGYELQVHHGFKNGDRTQPDDYKTGFGTGSIFRFAKVRWVVPNDREWCTLTLALLHVARLINETGESADWGITFEKPKIDLDKLRSWKDGVIEQLTGGIEGLCKARGVTLMKARGRFVDSHSLELKNANGERERVNFKNCVIATGSSPVVPGPLKIDDPRVMDSTGALRLEDIPEKLLVVGGGYIGLEMGTVYAALGSKVTVVEMTAGLLPGADRDLVRPLKTRLDKQFAAIHLNAKVEKLTAESDGIAVEFSGEEAPENQTFDRVLISVGRRPNSGDLGLENTKVEVDERGFIKVDDKRRTTESHLMAIGDVAGEPMLAHKATYEAKVVIGALAGEPAAYDPRAIPAVVFTDPELAWCGLTETEAKEAGQTVQVFRFPWAASGRAQTLARTEGVTKLIADPDTERILGMGVVGPGAGELIAEGVLAVEMGANIRDVADTIHAHPTMSETVMEAAEGLMGHATHVYRKRR
eukprot:g32965.t1